MAPKNVVQITIRPETEFKDALRELRKQFGEAKSEATKAEKATGGAFTSIARKAKKAFSDVGKSAETAADGLGKVGDAADDVQDQVSDSAKEAGRSLTNELGDAARKAAQQLGNAFQGTGIDQATRRIGDQVEELGQRFPRAARVAETSFNGLGRTIGASFNGVQGAAQKSLSGLGQIAKRSADGVVKAFQSVDRGVTNAFNKASNGAKRGLKSLGNIAKGAAFEIGAQIAQSLGDALSAGFSQIGFENRLQFLNPNLFGEEVKAAADTAADVFRSGFGESIGQVQQTVQGLIVEIARFDKEADLGSLTKQATALADIFGKDVNELIRSASALMSNGLASSAEEAFDIIATGLRDTGIRGDDLLETFEEYSLSFRDIGLTGQEALNLITAAVNGGARSTDGAADAIKESFLRITDGAKPIQEVFDELGLNLADIQKEIDAGNGGEAFTTVLQALGDVESQSDRARLAQILLGGTFEQVGLEGVEAMVAAADASLDTSGAAQEAADSINTLSFDRIKREITFGVGKAFAALTPTIRAVGAALKPVIDAYRTGFSGGEIDDLPERFQTFAKAGQIARRALEGIKEAATVFFRAFKGEEQNVTGALATVEKFGKSVRENFDIISEVAEGFYASLSGESSDGLEGFAKTGFEIGNVLKEIAPLLLTVGAFLGDVALAAVDVVTFLAPLFAILAQIVVFLVKVVVAVVDFATSLTGIGVAIFDATDGLSSFSSAWDFLKAAVSGVLTPIQAVIGFVAGLVGAFFTSGAASKTASVALTLLKGSANVLGTAIKIVAGVIGSQLKLALAVFKLFANGANTSINAARAAFNAGLATIQAFVAVGRNQVEAMRNGISNSLRSIGAAVGALKGRITSAARGMWDSVWNGFRNIINRVIRGWNRLAFRVPSVEVPGFGTIGGQRVGVRQIPFLADGGAVFGPTLAVVGDNPGARTDPEIVAPESRIRNLFEEVLARIPVSGGDRPNVNIEQIVTPPGRDLWTEVDNFLTVYGAA